MLQGDIQRVCNVVVGVRYSMKGISLSCSVSIVFGDLWTPLRMKFCSVVVSVTEGLRLRNRCIFRSVSSVSRRFREKSIDRWG